MNLYHLYITLQVLVSVEGLRLGNQKVAEFRVLTLGFRGLGFPVLSQGVGFRVRVSRFRVLGFRAFGF